MQESNPRSEILPFDFRGSPVRVVKVDGQPWFVAADVAKILGYRDAANAVRTLRDQHKGTQPVSTPRGLQDLTVISRSGLFRLALRSDRAEADSFQDWVTDEVLPAISDTGAYVAPAQRGEMLPDISTPEGVSVMADMFAATARQLVAAKQTIAEIAPAAESWETLASGTGDYSVADAAKILSRDPRIKLGQQRLFTHLMDLHWLYRQAGDRKWRAYQTAITRGWLSEIPASHYHPRTAELVIDAPQVRVTVKGLQRLHQQFGGASHLALPAPVSERLF